MKTKSLFFAALVLVSSVALAGKDEPRRTGMAVVQVKGSETFKVIYKGETAGKVKVNIYNSEAKVILSQTINTVDGFILPVNFSGLNAGEYTVEIVDAAGKKIEKVSIGSKNFNAVHVSKIAQENGKYLLSVANTTPGQEINVKIFDANNNIIHNETKVVSADFAMVYKLNAASSAYTFEVSDNAGKTKTIRF